MNLRKRREQKETKGRTNENNITKLYGGHVQANYEYQTNVTIRKGDRNTKELNEYKIENFSKKNYYQKNKEKIIEKVKEYNKNYIIQ